MKFYVGLDVGLEETSLCIVDGEGLTVRELKVSTEPAAIPSAAEGYADRLERVGVEASSLGIWLYRELQPAGFPIIVVEARHMRVSLSTMRNKTDRNDARGIAQMMRLGWYRAVHVKNIDMQKMRTLLTSRKLLKRKLIDLENHIRGALRAYGLLVGAVARGAFEARVRELIERSDPIFVMTIEAMLNVRRAIFEGYDRLHRVLLQVVQHDAVCRRLMTVPGVGPVAALSFKVGVDDPHRFARSRTVGAHFGLAPRRHQSGTSIDYEGRISKQGDVAVREALCEAAASLLLRGQEMVGTAGVGPADRQTLKHAVRDHRGRAQTRKHSAPDVGQRDRFPRRFWRQNHAAPSVETCTVAAVQIRWTSAGFSAQLVDEGEKFEIRARGERPLAGPRNGECPLSLACRRPSGMRAPDCLDSPVYEPDEEHATANVLNAKERMDPAWRMHVAHAAVAKLRVVGAGSLSWLKCDESKKSVGMS